MTEYLILQTQRKYDDWIAGYCPTEGAYYRTLKKGAVQTDLFNEVAEKWELVDYFYDNDSRTPTTKTIEKLAMGLVAAGFKLEDTLAIVRMKDLYPHHREPSSEIPQYSEQHVVGSLQEKIKKIIAGK